MVKQIKITSSKFLRVRCPKCENEQVIFGKASTIVKCIKCNTLMAKPASSKAKIKAKVLEVCK